MFFRMEMENDYTVYTVRNAQQKLIHIEKNVFTSAAFPILLPVKGVIYRDLRPHKVFFS